MDNSTIEERAARAVFTAVFGSREYEDMSGWHSSSFEIRSWDYAVAAVAAALRAERERCIGIAALYIIKGNQIHPDVTFDMMSMGARRLAHATCQCIAAAIAADGSEADAEEK